MRTDVPATPQSKFPNMRRDYITRSFPQQDASSCPTYRRWVYCGTASSGNSVPARMYLYGASPKFPSPT